MNTAVNEPNGYNGGSLVAEFEPKGRLFLLEKDSFNRSQIAGLNAGKQTCTVEVQRALSWQFKNDVQIPFPVNGYRGWTLLKLSNLSSSECHIQLK